MEGPLITRYGYNRDLIINLGGNIATVRILEGAPPDIGIELRVGSFTVSGEVVLVEPSSESLTEEEVIFQMNTSARLLNEIAEQGYSPMSEFREDPKVSELLGIGIESPNVEQDLGKYHYIQKRTNGSVGVAQIRLEASDVFQDSDFSNELDKLGKLADSLLSDPLFSGVDLFEVYSDGNSESSEPFVWLFVGTGDESNRADIQSPPKKIVGAISKKLDHSARYEAASILASAIRAGFYNPNEPNENSSFYEMHKMLAFRGRPPNELEENKWFIATILGVTVLGTPPISTGMMLYLYQQTGDPEILAFLAADHSPGLNFMAGGARTFVTAFWKTMPRLLQAASDRDLRKGALSLLLTPLMFPDFGWVALPAVLQGDQPRDVTDALFHRFKERAAHTRGKLGEILTRYSAVAMRGV